MRLSESDFTPNYFADFLGIQTVYAGRDGVDMALELRNELLNSYHVAHGGVSMTMLDIVMAKAARWSDPYAQEGEMGRKVVTVEMKTSFLRPARPGKLTAHGQIIQVTESLAFTQGWAMDSYGKKVAHATGLFKYLREGRNKNLKQGNAV